MHQFTRSCIAVASLTLCSGGAFAQTASPAKVSANNLLDEIIVTAQRVSTNLQNTPVAVTALSANELTQKGATSLLDLGAYTPSLTVSSRSTFGATRGGFTMRGIGTDSAVSSPSVGIYIDEVYYPSGIGNLLGFFDIDRIEVLRGPQGTLFGRNTIAGAVQYVSAKPDAEFGGSIMATAGSHKRHELGAVVNVPINDLLALRLSARNNNNGGYVTDDLNGVKRGGDRTNQARLQIRFVPNKDLTVDLKAEALHLKTNGRAIAVNAVSSTASLALAGATFNPVTNPRPETRPLTSAYISSSNYHFAGYNSPDYLNSRFSTGQIEVAYNLNDRLSFKSISAYSHSDNRLISDVDNTPLALAIADRGLTTNQLFTQEFQLAGRSLNNQLKWTTGAYYFDSKESLKNGFVLFGNNGPLVSQNRGDTQIANLANAVYGQVTYSVTEQLSATVGLRYSTEKVTGSFLNSTSPIGGVFGPATVAPRSATFSNSSPHFSINYQADPNLLVYGKASKGFRAGGFNVSANLLPSLGTAFSSFSPEMAWTYEVGARFQTPNGRLRFNPTVFWTDWKNIQFNSLFPVANTVLQLTDNAGNARIKGFELETQYALSNQWLVTGSASVLNGRYTKITLLTPAVTTSDELQHVPKFKYAVGGRHTLALASGGRVVSTLDYAWTAKQRSAVTNTDYITQPSNGILNGRVQFENDDGRYSVALYGTNLTNKYYLIGGVNGSTTFGTVEHDLARPREFGVTAKINF